MQTLFNRNAVA